MTNYLTFCQSCGDILISPEDIRCSCNSTMIDENGKLYGNSSIVIECDTTDLFSATFSTIRGNKIIEYTELSDFKQKFKELYRNPETKYAESIAKKKPELEKKEQTTEQPPAKKPKSKKSKQSKKSETVENIEIINTEELKNTEFV